MFKPFNRELEVQPLKEETFGDLPDASFQEKGIVMSVADDVTTLQVGDIIYFNSWSADKFTRNDTVFYLVEEGNVKAYEREEIPE